jgi:hypothetical protein
MGSRGQNTELVRKSIIDNSASRLSRLVGEITEAAKRFGLEGRRDRILREVGYGARGPACRLREKYMIIIDRDQPPSEPIEVLVEALRAATWSSHTYRRRRGASCSAVPSKLNCTHVCRLLKNPKPRKGFKLLSRQKHGASG